MIINPGNPTGQCMSIEEVRAVLEFAAREGLVLLADEVYQTNVYNVPGSTRLAHESNHFHSFRKAYGALQVDDPELASHVQLVSMHSVSKASIIPIFFTCHTQHFLISLDFLLNLNHQGFVGECGLRGGFFALDGAWEPAVKAQFVKLASICLCANVIGQLTMGLVINPPR